MDSRRTIDWLDLDMVSGGVLECCRAHPSWSIPHMHSSYAYSHIDVVSKFLLAIESYQWPP